MSLPVVMPMFPLGTVLLPSMLLPLRLFEPRYRAFARDVTGSDGIFGVTLIERGSEVGGGDVRSTVGCAAQVLQAEEHPDGQWGLVAVGTGRVRVARWLDDDPYPRAEVTPWPDPPPGPGAVDVLDAVVPAFHSVVALAAEAMATEPPAVELSDDPTTAAYQIATVAPFGAFDRQRILTAASFDDRVALLAELLDDAEAVLRARLG